jgi:hypothetical protein
MEMEDGNGKKLIKEVEEEVEVLLSKELINREYIF